MIPAEGTSPLHVGRTIDDGGRVEDRDVCVGPLLNPTLLLHDRRDGLQSLGRQEVIFRRASMRERALRSRT